MREFEKRRSGSVLIGVIIMAIIVGVVAGNYLKSASLEYKLSRQTVYMQSALNLAEAGLEEAFLGIEKSDWSTWTRVGSGVYYKNISSVSFGDGTTGTVKVYIDSSGSESVLVSEGTVADALGNSATKQVFISLSVRSLFANGLTSKDSITFSGNNVVVDSYDSTLGPYDGPSDGGTNYSNEGSVASTSVVTESIGIGNGTVYGYAFTGPGLVPGVRNGYIGPTRPAPIRGYDTDYVSDDFTSDIPDVVIPSLTADYSVVPDGGTIGVAGASVPTVYDMTGNFRNDSSDVLEIDGPVVIIIDGNFSVRGEIEITEYGSAEFYISGDADFGGNGVANKSDIPEKLMIYGTSTTSGAQTISVHGNGQASFVVYAPYAEVTMNGGGSSGEMSGAVVAESIRMTGNANFHYDVNLKNLDSDGAKQLGYWRELKGNSRIDFTSTGTIATGLAALVAGL